MTRRTLIFFLLILGSFPMGLLLVGRYVSGISPDGEIAQLMMLGSLVLSNVIYLFYRLYKINDDAAVMFIAIFTVAMPIEHFVYRPVLQRPGSPVLSFFKYFQSCCWPLSSFFWSRRDVRAPNKPGAADDGHLLSHTLSSNPR
jgi:hypothetical protein